MKNKELGTFLLLLLCVLINIEVLSLSSFSDHWLPDFVVSHCSCQSCGQEQFQVLSTKQFLQVNYLCNYILYLGSNINIIKYIINYVSIVGLIVNALQ